MMQSNGVRIVGVIPCRMGSKSIHKKNLEQINGRSLLEISAAAASVACDEWFVSSESYEIANYCGARGYDFLERPACFAEDWSTDYDFLRHHIDVDLSLEDRDWIVLVRPTSPLRTVDALLRFKTVLRRSNSSSVRSIVESPLTPYKMWSLDADSYLIPLPLSNPSGLAEPHNSPRQQLPPIFWQTGTYDAYRVENIRSGRLSGPKIESFFANHVEVDIDQMADLEHAKKTISRGLFDWV